MERLLEVTLSMDDNDVCEIGIHDAETGDWTHRSFSFINLNGNNYNEDYVSWLKNFGEWITEEIYSWFMIMRDTKGE